MTNEHLKINRKFLFKMLKTVKSNPTITISVLDAIDVYNIKKHSPHVEDERLYRVCLCSLPNDKLINRFGIQMKDFDIHIGTHTLSIKEIALTKMKKWKEYKAIKEHIGDFKPYEEVKNLEIKKFIDFCKDNNITEEMIWQLLLDDTYSKSEELLKVFYPTILPLPHYKTDLQKYNSHGLLFTQAKTGKSETCYRLYPKENYETVSMPTLLGTADKTSRKVGLLDGIGLFFVDEINKMSDIRSGEDTHSKFLDFINTYLEKGIEKRGVWGQSLEVSGTKTVILSGNVNVARPGQRDFYHLMSKICIFGGDADKFGRRMGWFLYAPKLNIVNVVKEIDSRIIELINSFRNEIIRDKTIQKKILKVIDKSLDWVHEKDTEHRKRIKKYTEQISSDAIKSFLIGLSMSSDMKLKFMSVKIIITKHIFELITGKTEEFLDKYINEMKCEYETLKEIICINQIENLLVGDQKDNKRDIFRKFITEKKININERIDDSSKEEWSKELKIPKSYINKLISSLKEKEDMTNNQES